MANANNSQSLANKKRVIAGLDIGTTKVACVIATQGTDYIEVIGVGRAATTGMKHGVVVNIEATTEAIKKAKEEAELMSGVSVEKVWLSIGGNHVESFDSMGMVAIKNSEVNREDIERVIEAAKAVAIPNDRQVLHVLPNDYKIDNQPGISDPIGMAGVRLETNVHIVTGAKSAIQNAIKCTENTGLKVQGLVLEQLASCKAVLSDDEKELGVAVVDIGGGTCDIISYSQGSVFHTGVVPVGGNNFTHDVAMGLRTTQIDAENLKKKFGCALVELVTEEETIDVEGVGGRQKRTIARKNLCEILEARAEETLQLIKKELVDSDVISKLGSGLVLTGGASQLVGLVEMGDFVFDLPVRKGAPQKVGGLTDVIKCSSYATAVGLLIYGSEQMKKSDKRKQNDYEDNFGDKISGWFRRAKEALSE
ncbi:MAG: cell division protein FtsA [Bdellovibrionaceae bacterium]|nr:cell division protein FtsA [Pseudobdellovibrionaceae bacterium]